ncbi:MAG: CotH kinase family protein, partial [Verrucomicrobiales bacterium]
TDDQRSNRTRIAHVPSWTSSQQWDKFPEQQSAPITLQAGGSYYFEALQKEGGGGDNLAVAWSGPGVPMEVISAEDMTPVDLASTSSLPAGIVVKARAFTPGGVPSDVVTRSYLFNQAPGLKTLPAVVLSGDPENSIYAPNGALSIVGGTHASGQWAPTSIDNDYNFAVKHGRPWERKATMEYINTDNTVGFSTDIGLRVAGSPHARPRYKFTDAESNTWTGSWVDKPSFNFYFRDDFGLDRLEYEIFEGSRVTTFDDFRLRAGKNDSSNPFIKDEFIRRLYLNMGQIGSRGLLCNLFVNGRYKGYYNLTERVREEFLREWHNTNNGFDIWHIREITEGDRGHYDATMSILRTLNMRQQANYQRAAERVDMTNYIDYIIVNSWSAMGDWPRNNYIIARERTDPGPWQFYVWDAEGCCGGFGHDVNYNTFTSDLDSTGHMTSLVYHACQPNGEFRLLFADRIQKHFFNGGALTPPGIRDVYVALRDELNPTMQAVRNTSVTEGWFNTWWNQRPPIYFSQLTAEGLWPSTIAPRLNQHGGNVAPGFQATLTNDNPSGEIYYTMDGTDPRATGGAVRGDSYDGPIPIDASTPIKARVLANGIWSPLTDVVFSTSVPALVISELNYNPTGPDDTAFIELLNAGPVPIELAGIYFSDGIGFTFTGGSLAPGEVVVVAENATAFSTRYPGVPIAGAYTGGLDNDGETVTISDIADNVIYSVTYGDGAPWPDHPDGGGSSLVPLSLFDQSDPDDPANWAASGFSGGTPGSIPSATITDWLLAVFAPGEEHSGMFDDGDFDRGNNLLEYAVAHDPKLADTPFVTASVADGGGQEYLAVTYRKNLAARDVAISIEVSTDLETWEPAPPDVTQLGTPVFNGDGSATVTYLVPVSSPRQHVRLRVTIL